MEGKSLGKDENRRWLTEGVTDFSQNALTRLAAGGRHQHHTGMVFTLIQQQKHTVCEVS